MIVVEADEREELLEEIGEYHESRQLDAKVLFMMLGLLVLSVIIFAPKIYLRNNIYFSSKEISQLQIQHDTLIEENRHLRRQLEDMKFQHLILDFEH